MDILGEKLKKIAVFLGGYGQIGEISLDWGNIETTYCRIGVYMVKAVYLTL